MGLTWFLSFSYLGWTSDKPLAAPVSVAAPLSGQHMNTVLADCVCLSVCSVRYSEGATDNGLLNDWLNQTVLESL